MLDCDLFSLATKGVQSLSPYQAGKPIDELKREYGVSDIIKLASNENPLGPSPKVLSVLKDMLAELSHYPDGSGYNLKAVLANNHAVDENQITLGNGSNDILEILTRAFVTPEHEIIFSQHAFVVYPIIAQAVGATSVVTPAKNWGHDLDAMQQAITDKTKLIFIANPNNPTGTWLNKNEIESFLQAIPKNVLVVLDEAYFEFADSDPIAKSYPNGIELTKQYSNLIVTRTFSKAYGLAGLRIGYSISSPQIADALNRVRQPFNVNSLALKAAEVAIADVEYLERGLKVNADGMNYLVSAFTEMNLSYIPSVGNFICLNVGDNAMKVYDDLLYEGVIVRPVANYEMPEYLRITIGTKEENERFVTALQKVLNK